jgi:hypothetical protein
MSEWQDGDDSALYDEGYAEGVADAVRLINDRLGVTTHSVYEILIKLSRARLSE